MNARTKRSLMDIPGFDIIIVKGCDPNGKLQDGIHSVSEPLLR